MEEVKDYAIFMLDPTGKILSWNEGAQKIKGYTAEEIIGQHFSIFYTSEDIERGKPNEELTFAAAEGRWEEEGWRLRKDGSRFWADVVITALHDKDGNLLGLHQGHARHHRRKTGARSVSAGSDERAGVKSRHPPVAVRHCLLRPTGQAVRLRRARALRCANWDAAHACA